MVIGRNGYGPKWLWAEMTRNRRADSQCRVHTIRPKKKIVVFQVPCKKKTGSVGRLFFFFFFFFANSTNQFVSFFFSSNKVQAMSSGCGSW